ncbi:PREDICTED: light-harvesting complex-like protein OHP1, chloroplastic [Tarenaya hassleriana]|uniref:light-harvesting complex-like protein OHP1, chloroplastic n=1 Tax=Tarenaya hassleriana TaxID=28532 RepID=UPI00053C4902|nr:PREDICTED: light-harvesting complex-like protein OHP1, chloroplastic [Tarenaya hassleriana]
MATSLMSSSPLSSTFLPSTRSLSVQGLGPNRNLGLCRKPPSFRVRAAKLPDRVIVPKAEPKFEAAFLGFTNTAEIWNSRACMIGLIGTFIVELILNKGILQVIGVDVGKGLDLPL